MPSFRWMALLVLLTSTVRSAAQTSTLDRISRIEILADVWSRAYIYHPRIATGGVDYNSVLFKALPLVEQADTDTEFVRILNDEVLGPLQDAQTSAHLASDERCGPSPSGTPQAVQAVKLSPAVAMVRVPDQRIQTERGNPFLDHFRSAVDSLGAFEKLVVDLRYRYDADIPAWTHYWLGLFTDKPLDQPHYLRRVHEGFNEFNSANNAYRQRWQIDGGDVLPRAIWDGVIRTPILTRVLFLVNNASYHRFARTLDALQRAGRAAVLWEDTGCAVGPDVEQYPGNIRVQLNGVQLLGGATSDVGRPDRTSATHITDGRIASFAEEMLTSISPRQSSALTVPPLRFQPYETPTGSLADRQHRLFWMIKVWMAVRFYDPHLEYASIDWPKALRGWVPRFEAARDEEAFFDVVRQMTARLNDSHVRVVAPRGHVSRTGFYPPVRLGRADGKVVVTAAGSEAEELVKPGDEVLEIDGRTVQQIERMMRLHVSASTEGAFHLTWNEQTRGPQNSEAVLTVTRNGELRTVQLKRTQPQVPTVKYTPVRTLAGGVGYINLFVLKSELELAEAFRKVHDARGLVLDLRGYPTYADVRRFLVSRLSNKPVKTVLTDIPLLIHDEFMPASFLKTYDYVAPVLSENYGGPVVVLINAEAQSYAEGICLYLTSAGRVTFVGSNTAGTTGGLTGLSLPGGWSLEFTGSRVSHADGRRFQNIGIVPDVKVEPTISGLAQGIDEVLEKGVEVVLSKLPAAP